MRVLCLANNFLTKNQDKSLEWVDKILTLRPVDFTFCRKPITRSDYSIVLMRTSSIHLVMSGSFCQLCCITVPYQLEKIPLSSCDK